MGQRIFTFTSSEGIQKNLKRGAVGLHGASSFHGIQRGGRQRRVPQ
jgi:hypothetical protein